MRRRARGGQPGIERSEGSALFRSVRGSLLAGEAVEEDMAVWMWWVESEELLVSAAGKLGGAREAGVDIYSRVGFGFRNRQVGGGKR